MSESPREYLEPLGRRRRRARQEATTAKSDDRRQGKDDPCAPAAPAVHSDRMWDGQTHVDHAADHPIPVETKADYFRVLNEHGWRMKDQQESSTGPEREPVPEIPIEFRPSPDPIPLTKDEAHAIGASIAFMKKYGFSPQFFCTHCFARKRTDVVAVDITSAYVTLRCGCGPASYSAPKGTTDLIPSLSTTPTFEHDYTRGSILIGDVAQAIPTVVLPAPDAEVFLAFMAPFLRRGIQPRIFCKTCWTRKDFKEASSIGISIASGRFALLCQCRMLVAHDLIH